jgi:hypothetical protein
MELVELLTDPAKGTEVATLVLTHGASGPMDSPFLSVISKSLAEAGIKVVRFEFPYMRGRRDHGAKKGLIHPRF